VLARCVELVLLLAAAVRSETARPPSTAYFTGNAVFYDLLEVCEGRERKGCVCVCAREGRAWFCVVSAQQCTAHLPLRPAASARPTSQGIDGMMDALDGEEALAEHDRRVAAGNVPAAVLQALQEQQQDVHEEEEEEEDAANAADKIPSTTGAADHDAAAAMSTPVVKYVGGRAWEWWCG
jgi:hypothetical protein